jgi:hypothetical protein
MLAMSYPTQRRQDIPEDHHFIPTHNHSLPLRNHQYLSPVPSEQDIARLSHSPLSTIESSPATSTVDYDPSEYYMPKSLQGNQSVRAQSSSRPASTQPPNSLSSSDVLTPQLPYWNQSLITSQSSSQPRPRFPAQAFHKRNSSDSTVTSSAPHSPFTPTSLPHQPFIVDPESHNYLPHIEVYDHNNQSVTSAPKNTPSTSAPFTDSLFFAPEFQNFSSHNADNRFYWERAMKQVLTHSPGLQMDLSRTHEMPEYSGDSNGSLSAIERNKVPGLGRTMSDIYQDELYNPEEPTVQIPTPAPTLKIDGSAVSPCNSVFSERLQAANQVHIIARSSSPTVSFAREKSPFRPTSEFAPEAYPSSVSPIPRLGSAARMREQQKAEAEALALAQRTQPRDVRENSQTVSPKEVSLDYEPEDVTEAPLFGEIQSPTRRSQRFQGPSKLNQELTRDNIYEDMSIKSEESNQSSHVPQIPQQYPFISRPRRPASTAGGSQESVPEFPARLVSMESTKSEPQTEGPEEEGEEAESDSESADLEVQRPTHTQADTGTYTCTYHGCTQRFETPQKLQKHKRDGHRQGTPSSGGDNRNTQAGPHKCERINPQTGKPCNSIFSRPYDLTRHEDTIHNAKKQKVRCMVCTEEKTFSRNDALTRHMRVVHPDVEFAGKVKRGR